jgi:hypothetical protein
MTPASIPPNILSKMSPGASIDRMTAAEYRRREGLSVETTAKPQIRIPAPVTMNKTEAAWMEQLKRKFHPAITTILYEPITLRLPSGTRYTPDFMVYQSTTQHVSLYEVKGPHIHNPRSIHAFKEAKAAYPFWTFIFAQKTKDGWATTEASAHLADVGGGV